MQSKNLVAMQLKSLTCCPYLKLQKNYLARDLLVLSIEELIRHDTFGLVSLFNIISTIVGYLESKESAG